MHIRRCVVSIVTLCLCGVPALATPMLTTTEAGWASAVAGLTPGPIMDFNSYTAGSLAGGLTTGDVTLQARPFNGGAVQLSILPGGYGSGALLEGPNGSSSGTANGYLQILLPAGTMAVSGYFDAVIGVSGVTPGSSVRFQAGATSLGTIATQGQAPLQFFGITSDSELSELRIWAADGGHMPVLDNLTVYTHAVVPPPPPAAPGTEPAAVAPETDTWLLALSGLVLTIAAARARRRARARR